MRNHSEPANPELNDQNPEQAKSAQSADSPDFKPIVAESRLRITSLDTVRGFALLGILALNIIDFAWPNPAYDSVNRLYYKPSSVGKIESPKKDDPKLNKDQWKRLEPAKPKEQSIFPGGILRTAAVSSHWDVGEWVVANVFFANKMRTLFCMMFGAGMIYLTQRSLDQGKRPVWLYYRRMIILLLIGAFHGYLIWHGDILFLYAATGLYLYPFRRFSTKTLAWISLSFFLGFVSLLWTGAGVIHHIRVTGEKLELRVKTAVAVIMAETSSDESGASANLQSKSLGDANVQAINQLSKFDQLMLRAYLGISRRNLSQKPEELTRTIRIYSEGSYLSQVRNRAEEVIWIHLVSLTPLSLLMFGWLMILGMSLAKSGFFAGQWPIQTYHLLAFRLLPLGWVLESLFMFLRRDQSGTSLLNLTIIMPIQQAVIPMISLGYAAVLILAIENGQFRWLTSRLASVGRMALSNYLSQSVICTFLFYSFGLGLFGSLPRTTLALIVFFIWLIQLWWSPKWLSKHPFGPVEWLWRSLTYMKRQPFQNQSTVS
ncbi:MAG: hypothetical protein RJA81_417 [Planctomycetota bacterium]